MKPPTATRRARQYYLANPSLRIQLLTCERTDFVRHFLTHCHLLRGEFLQVLSARIQEACESQAGAVELTNDHRRLCTIYGDKVSGPQKGDVLLRQAESLDVVLQFGLQFRLDGLQRQLSCIWEIVGADRVDGRLGLTADATNVDVVLNAEEFLANHYEARLALVDPGTEALIDHLTTGLHSALEVLARALGFPGARCVSPAILAPLDELFDCVLLDVVVIRLLQNQHFILCCHSVTIVFAVVLFLQLNNPNALSGRSAVLLYNTLLECNGLGKIPPEFVGGIISKGVGETK